jgi:hypothetical protein
MLGVVYAWRREFCVEYVGMMECKRRWGKLGSFFFLYVMGCLTMLGTCRRSSELENASEKRETLTGDVIQEQPEDDVV